MNVGLFSDVFLCFVGRGDIVKSSSCRDCRDGGDIKQLVS